MLDLQTLIFQFGLPGLPLSFIITFLLLPNRPVTDLTLMALALSLLLGYIIQQLWFLIFEKSKWSYDNENRKVLAFLKKELINNKKNPAIRKKWNIDENDLGGDKLFAIWESVLYISDETKQATPKLRGIWRYFHSNMAIVLGLIFGTIAYFYFHIGWSNFIPVAFIFCAVILVLKAIRSKEIVDELEKNWAEEFIQKIEGKPTRK